MENQTDLMKETYDFICERNFSSWSCYRVGTIVGVYCDSKHICNNVVMRIPTYEYEDVNEIALMLSHILSCNVRMESDDDKIYICIE